MKKIWPFLTAFFAGVASAFFIAFKNAPPTQETNYDIGNIKNKGDGNNIDLKVSTSPSDELPSANTEKTTKLKIFKKARTRRQLRRQKK
jgi:hypothetical protein